MKKHLLLIATLFLVFFVGAGSASAQDAQKTPEATTAPMAQAGSDDFQKATAVFSGQVVQVNRKENDPNGTVKFTVQKVWKGKNSKEMTVAITKDGGDCSFEVGKVYRVYTSEINGKNQINCSKTAPLGEMAATPAKEN